MSGHKNVNELLRPIMENPERRARVAEEKRIQEARVDDSPAKTAVG